MNKTMHDHSVPMKYCAGRRLTMDAEAFSNPLHPQHKEAMSDNTHHKRFYKLFMKKGLPPSAWPALYCKLKTLPDEHAQSPSVVITYVATRYEEHAHLHINELLDLLFQQFYDMQKRIYDDNKRTHMTKKRKHEARNKKYIDGRLGDDFKVKRQCVNCGSGNKMQC